ncbi:HU family DNA-binding protein [Cellulomonas bogoriensis]|uniref:Integration host factor n=1 Tax=Cellulomonas bogoriensis 69B4 = DSM 16987 TaxID=1386082 RepID=A0A0A0C3A8_9CELL|nr:HU family DNA-binding protein [Cellulomonas bogoriensis]KGM14517.1 integration host factor [Cellulomonas bogoriensis 69B4 = DSM 16987]
MALTRNDVVARIAERTGNPATEVAATLTALQELLVESLREGQAVRLTGLMTVERTDRAARTGRNPRTGETLEIPAGHGVRITAGTALKDAAKG